MASFKIGQRVKVIGGVWPVVIGTETVILALPGCDSTWPDHYQIEVNAAMRQVNPSPLAFWFCGPEHLAPLVDPKAVEFIEQVKKWDALRVERVVA